MRKSLEELGKRNLLEEFTAPLLSGCPRLQELLAVHVKGMLVHPTPNMINLLPHLDLEVLMV